MIPGLAKKDKKQRVDDFYSLWCEICNVYKII